MTFNFNLQFTKSSGKKLTNNNPVPQSSYIATYYLPAAGRLFEYFNALPERFVILAIFY